MSAVILPCQILSRIQVSPVVPIKSFITEESSLGIAVATHRFSFGAGGCTGSSLLHAGFLQLWRVGAALPAVPGLLVAAASLAVEHRL